MERVQLEVGLTIQINSIGVMSAEPSWKGEWHSHPFWELLYVQSGEMAVQTENPAATAAVGAGELAIKRPFRLHRTLNGGESPALCMYLGCDCRQDSSALIGDEDETTARFRDYPGKSALSGIMEDTCRRMDTLTREELCALQLKLIPELSALFEYMSRGNRQPVTSSESIADRVRRYIESNPGRNITAQEIARSIYVSAHYLGITFKKQTGMTVSEYLLRVRMANALELLRQSGLSIGEVSERLGYDTPQYFSSSFKKYYGVPPSDFVRKKIL